MAPYSALAVANYFLDLAKASRTTLDPMKLQKLIYFAHGWHLALYKEPLINEEVQAWQYGPVVQSVYHEFKQFGAGAITKLATDIDFENGEIITPRIPLEDSQTMGLLNRIWEIYGKYSGVQLSHLTHEQNSAWFAARKGRETFKFVGIQDPAIRKDFESKMAAG